MTHTTHLSVNVNKIATLRNARGGSRPSVTRAAQTCIDAGCHGITVHPRPDARHITHEDVYALRDTLPQHIEFNIEGYPTPEFLRLVADVRPHQCTLVPDPPGILTSNAGWDLTQPQPILQEALSLLSSLSIRSSIFLEPNLEHVQLAAEIGTDRIELYTGPYAAAWGTPNLIDTFLPYQRAAAHASSLGLGINAGHDLDQHNLPFFALHTPNLLEVSIGHALISDALYDGLTQTVQAYLRALQAPNT